MGEGGVQRIIHGEAGYCSDRQGFAIASSFYQHLNHEESEIEG